METYTPYIRYFLILLLGYMVASDWIPEDFALLILNDPFLTQVSIEAALGGSILFWYRYSESRKALLEKKAFEDALKPDPEDRVV